jgi:hypothetical protein
MVIWPLLVILLVIGISIVPWWNRAVEAQALDRAHPIGRTRLVFAYRQTAHDTVEEKVLHVEVRDAA